MDRWMGKIAVVTGASSGIGLATAKAFIRHGMTVVGLARRHEKMKTEMAGTEEPGKFYARQCDLSKLTDIEATFDWIQTELGTVHILINSAAVKKPGSIQDVSNEDLMAMIGVNFMGALHCMKQAIPLMRANGENRQIVNINSPYG
ncbi:unnamed protein product [Bemisia tabaci]|uniref:Short-chain dehydrogenase n=2 Tax=Bemisia tabaci TaxID=7038 RepID=A0A9P0FZG9_BEMTA|nr:unnamed protein product [Bemisia tabaci]